MINSKEGQAWGFDLFVALFLFFLGVLFLYFFIINNSPEAEDKLNNLFYDGEVISDNLVSSGFPLNWGLYTVKKIGIVDEDRVNQTKLDIFYNLSKNNYTLTKSLFRTRYNYFVNFSSPIIIDGELVQGIGNEPINAKNVVRVTRVVIYKNEPVLMSIDVWE